MKNPLVTYIQRSGAKEGAQAKGMGLGVKLLQVE
jgi:hypothetical protein